MAITFSITYAGLTIGGSSEYYLLHCGEGEAPMRLSLNNAVFTLSAFVICRGSTVAEFTTKANALEAAWRTLAGDLSYTFGASTTSFSQSANTGMNAEPSIEKVGSLKFDSDRSRLYQVSVRLKLPADAAGKNGLRQGTIEIRTEPGNGRVTATIAGVVTALSSASAYAQTGTCITAMVSELVTALSLTMQPVDPKWIKYDDRNKEATFVHTLREILYAESSGGLDHASITTSQFVIERAETYPGDHNGNGPPARLVAVYSADVVKAITDLPAFWNSTVKPWLISRLCTIAAAGGVAILEIKPTFDLWNNRISASAVMLACVSTSWGRRITTETERETGVRLVPVWNGDPYARAKSQSFATRRLTITEAVTRLGGSTSTGVNSGTGGGNGFQFGSNGGGTAGLGQPGGISFGFFGSQFNGQDQRGQLGQIDVGGGSGGAQQAPATTGLGGVSVPQGYELIRDRERSYPEIVGSPDARYLTTVEYREQVYEYARPVSAGAGSAGFGGGGTTVR